MPSLFLALHLFVAPAHAGLWSWFRRCGPALEARVELVPNEEQVKANGVQVSGEDIYSTPLVLDNLGLDEVTVRALAGKKVLSVGEGFSGLVGHLRSQGVAAKALDIWYGQKEFPDNFIGNRMKEYVENNRAFLITGGARQIPALNRSRDLVVSHMLVNNIPYFDSLYYLAEALRITKTGGEIRFFGFNPDVVPELTKVIEKVFKRSVTFTFEKKEFTHGSEGAPHTRTNYLLTMKVVR